MVIVFSENVENVVNLFSIFVIRNGVKCVLFLCVSIIINIFIVVELMIFMVSVL